MRQIHYIKKSFQVLPGPSDIRGLDGVWLAVESDRWFPREMLEVLYKMGLVEITAIVDDIEPVEGGVGALEPKGVIEAQYPGIVFGRHAHILRKIAFERAPRDIQLTGKLVYIDQSIALQHLILRVFDWRPVWIGQLSDERGKKLVHRVYFFFIGRGGQHPLFKLLRALAEKSLERDHMVIEQVYGDLEKTIKPKGPEYAKDQPHILRRFYKQIASGLMTADAVAPIPFFTAGIVIFRKIVIEKNKQFYKTIHHTPFGSHGLHAAHDPVAVDIFLQRRRGYVFLHEHG